MYVPEHQVKDLTTEQQHLVAMRALALTARRPLVFSHWSAAIPHDLATPRNRLHPPPHGGAAGNYRDRMQSGRIEAFSDGVIAILITIMVLELPRPEGVHWSALTADLRVLLAYVLSFVYLAIYWNNHHHMFQIVRTVRGGALWANLHLLFWLSLVPFTTGWLSDQTRLTTVPVVVYGLVLLAAGFAYWVLQRTLIRAEGVGSRLAAALGKDVKSPLSLILYTVGILVGFVLPILSLVVYVAVALIWLVPDRRVERFLVHEEEQAGSAAVE